MPVEPRPLRSSSPLPPYRAVLAVDVEKYTGNGSYHQQIISSTIETVLEEAFARSGLAEVWAERRFPQKTGDGYVIGVEPENLPFLIHPLLGHLQEALEDAQPGLATHDRELRLRLRASIDVGPLPDSGNKDDPIDGIGRAMNDTHRLLDSGPVRQELRLSDRDITLLVAIVSGRVYDEAVLGKFVGVNPRKFRPVDVELPQKEFRQQGYLFVPAPSRSGEGKAREATEPTGDTDDGDDGSPGPPDTAGPPPDPRSTGPTTGQTANSIGDNYGQAVQGGTIHGGIHGGGLRGRRDG
ncbi:hypothetical protein [Streptomonospora arabica]|uniref:Uncharacterized protein n=1 Tax=Streptomonospora arabica TaxID=412417 RepID=A0ABV9SP32_9ACTN